MLPPIDLIIAIDTTSSMTGEVASLREEIAGLSELLADLTEDAAVGIIDFKDGSGRQPALRVAPLRRIDRQSVRRLAAFARSMRPGSAACNVDGGRRLPRGLAGGRQRRLAGRQRAPLDRPDLRQPGARQPAAAGHR